MTPTLPAELLQLIQCGKSSTVELNLTEGEITEDVYQTVCAFSNRDGGNLFLGVRDNGEISGIEEDKIDQLKKDFVSSVRDERKIYPPLSLTPLAYTFGGRRILYIAVPVSQDVCRFNGRIYDRIGESDIDITYCSDKVFRLYQRKSGSCYVDMVFPAFGVSDLCSDLIDRARAMTHARSQNHPWLHMTDEEILRGAGLVRKSPESGKEGLTLAAILLFGTDQLIMSVLPQYKTDALFRVFGTERFDDRDVVITNLLESFDRLMEFGKKHLNDTFHLEGILSVSARNRILGEIISNLLMHRDFSSAYVAKLVIERDRLYTENASLSRGQGTLNPAALEPSAKNPPIAKVFREIGLTDEPGSGIRNTYRYTEMYSGGEPRFVEGDVFRVMIPLSEAATATVGPVPSGSSASSSCRMEQ